jgi:signal transduction histidine kinase
MEEKVTKEQGKVNEKDKVYTDILGKVSAILAHEIKNPLGSISLFLSLLKKELEHSVEFAELLNGIQLSVNTIDNVLKNFLLFSETSRIEFTPINICALVSEQAALVDRFLKTTSIEVVFEGTPYVYGNENALRYLVYNLLINAAHATEFKGRVIIRGSSMKGSDDKLLLEVIDNGIGIPDDVKEKIFDPFFTTKKDGTGIGLAIASHIVKRHNGEIGVKDNSLKGTVFWITLSKKIF